MALIRNIFFSLLFTVISSYAQQVKHGHWDGDFFLNDSVLMPFRFEVSDSGFVFLNADEKITAKKITHKKDSVFVELPVFDSEFRWKILRDTLNGVFINHSRLNNQNIYCRAVYGKHVPLVNEFEIINFTGRWSAVFDGDDPPLNVAVAELSQTGNHLTGTFLTPTGDYRYLEGYLTGSSSFYLSAFDGSHVFYFSAALDPDTLRGHYYSGTHWHDTWKAWRNEKASLPHPDSLNFLKKGYTSLSFSFPDTDSTMVSLNDAGFKNKVVLIQIMGSWCPNCMDETAFLVPLYDSYHKKGLEIIGLDYERSPDFIRAVQLIKKYSRDLKVNYPVLFAGSTDRKSRAKSLPQLNDIVGFPTTIFIDRNGNVRKIHTGFNGPATGIHYQMEKNFIRQMIEKLLVE